VEAADEALTCLGEAQVKFLNDRNCTRGPTPNGQDRWRRLISQKWPRAIILMIPAAMVTGRWARRAMWP